MALIARFARRANEPGVRRFLACAFLAWLILAGFILGRFANEVLPPHYLVRPLIAAGVVALGIGVISSVTGRLASTVAAVAAVLIVLPAAGIPLVVAVAALLILRRTVLRNRQLKLLEAANRIVPPIAAAFFLLGGLNAIRLVDTPPDPPPVSSPAAGPSFYLVLLDGYPRADTLLEDLGIDNASFLAQLGQRGFDVYGDARSPRHWTELTLLAMLDGSSTDVPHEAGSVSEKREVRQRLDSAGLPRRAIEMGYDYVVIDSPIGHVTFAAGRHIYSGGLNSLEDWLLRRSVFAGFVRTFAAQAITDSLRMHLDASLTSLSDLVEPGTRRLVLAHIMAPHLPFLFAANGELLPAPPYWPSVMLFASTLEEMEMDFDYYLEYYPDHLQAVNDRLLETVDRMIARDPDAVIVLFSDHGARYSYTHPEEWSKAFLAARSPGRTGLYGEEPSVEDVLCQLLVQYLGVNCE